MNFANRQQHEFCLRNIFFAYTLHVNVHYVIQRWQSTVRDTRALTKSCFRVYYQLSETQRSQRSNRYTTKDCFVRSILEFAHSTEYPAKYIFAFCHCGRVVIRFTFFENILNNSLTCPAECCIQREPRDDLRVCAQSIRCVFQC